MLSILITVATILVVGLNFVSSYLTSRGHLKAVYYCMIIGSIIYSTLNTSIALRDSAQWSLILLNINSIYSGLMGYFGLRRLKRENSMYKRYSQPDKQS